MRRHISQDSLTRRKGRSAVGSSEEEIARRAELKRLMHKRIQDELRSEAGQDAQSDASSRHVVRRRGEPLPGGGPRDNLEFSVAEASDDSHISQKRRTGLVLTTDPRSTQPTDEERDVHGNVRPRRASCPECFSIHTTSAIPGLQSALHQRLSLPKLSTVAYMAPENAPGGACSSSLGSWLWSCSTGQLGDLLSLRDDSFIKVAFKATVRPFAPEARLPISSSQTIPYSVYSLSRSYSSPARHDRQAKVSTDQSPLNTWLREVNVFGSTRRLDQQPVESSMTKPSQSLTRSMLTQMACGSGVLCRVMPPSRMPIFLSPI